MKKFSLTVLTTLSSSQRNDNDEKDNEGDDDDNSDDGVMKKFSFSDSPDDPLLPAKRQR